MAKKTIQTATIAIYGTREVGFSYLASIGAAGNVFGDHESGARKHESATEALFAACDAAAAKGANAAFVHYDRKRADGRTEVLTAKLDPTFPAPWGSLAWSTVTID